MTIVELNVSQQLFDTLHGIADTRRRHVKVETQGLTQLLIDYGVMLKALRAAGVKVNEAPRRNRPKLTTHAPDIG